MITCSDEFDDQSKSTLKGGQVLCTQLRTMKFNFLETLHLHNLMNFKLKELFCFVIHTFLAA